MIIYKKDAGVLKVPDGKIGIGDPGYAIVDYLYDVVPGEYKCSSWTGREKGWGTRVWKTEIVLNKKRALKLADNDEKWQEAGMIGVDAGLAGYFVNKPTFNKEENWFGFCDYTYKKKNFANKIYDTCLLNNTSLFKDTNEKDWSGFWSGTGIGDGIYTLYKLVNNKNEIIGLRLNYAD